MELEDTPAFTKIPDTDLRILGQLSDKDLYETCQSNRYLFHLCQNSKTLRERVRKYAHKFDIFEAGQDISGEFLLAMDPETLYNTCQLNTYSFSLCQNNPVLRKRIHDYKQFLIKVNNIINNQMYAILIKDPSYHKIVDILANMNVKLHDTSNIEGIYDNPQIYNIDVYYGNYTPNIDVYYIDRGIKNIDEFKVTSKQIKTFLITNYNNHTIDIGEIH